MSAATAVKASPAISVGKLEEKFYQIPVGSLSPSATNPRKHFDEKYLAELADSIREKGIQQPLLVRPSIPSRSEESYEIIAGECRYRAAKLAGLALVPCLVRLMDDEAALDVQIVENLQRRDLSPLEEAAAFRNRLKAAGDAGAKITVADLAKKIGKAPRWVYDRLELLKLTPFAQEALANGKISPGHAAVIVALDPKRQDDAVRVTARADLSVMTLRDYVRGADRADIRALKWSSSAAEAASMPTKAQLAHYSRSTEIRREAADRKLPTASSLHDSYSGDVISKKRTIRAPFSLNGELLCCVGAEGVGNGRDVVNLEAYRVIPRRDFAGRTWDYNSRALQGDKARNDRKGFYHGVRVKWGGRDFVLCGPEKLFKRDPASEPSRETIERALQGQLPGLRVCSLSAARKRGEYVAVFRVQQNSQKSSRTSVKRGKKAA